MPCFNGLQSESGVRGADEAMTCIMVDQAQPT
jgi:hypothetical protein